MSRGPKHDAKGNPRRGKGSGGQGFVKVDQGMLQSAAWASLSGDAAKVFLDMSRKHWAFNGELSFSGQQAGDVIGKSRATGNRALLELEDRGFIVREVPAMLGVTGRMASVWRLTPYPVQRGKTVLSPPSRDFRNWKPKPQETPKPLSKKQKRCSMDETMCVTHETKPLVIDLAERLRVTHASQGR